MKRLLSFEGVRPRRVRGPPGRDDIREDFAGQVLRSHARNARAPSRRGPKPPPIEGFDAERFLTRSGTELPHPLALAAAGPAGQAARRRHATDASPAPVKRARDLADLGARSFNG